MIENQENLKNQIKNTKKLEKISFLKTQTKIQKHKIKKNTKNFARKNCKQAFGKLKTAYDRQMYAATKKTETISNTHLNSLRMKVCTSTTKKNLQ